ncbi:MAG: M48 family metalloprotease [Sphingomonas sp.]
MIQRLFILSIALFAAVPATAQPQVPQVHAIDGRVATIGHRLAVANLAWCTDRQWLTGVTLGVEVPAASRERGSLLRPTVLALARGGPAERAGLAANDVIESVDTTAMPRATLTGDGEYEGMDRVRDAFEAPFADGSATISIGRAGTQMRLMVPAELGCASRFLVISSRGLNAYADGIHVQVTSAIADYVLDEQELAAILAHEFAHNVLRHRARLDAAGVARGLLANFGRNARLIRETEAEADRLSVWLLARAGYDPEAAGRFWRRFGQRGLNIFGSPTHGGWRGRVSRFDSEIAIMRAAGPNGRPALLPPAPAG